MPTTRSTAATTGQSTDWSLNTPTETTEISSRSTLTRRTPPPQADVALPSQATEREHATQGLQDVAAATTPAPVKKKTATAKPSEARTPQTTKAMIQQHDELMARISESQKRRKEQEQSAIPTTMEPRSSTRTARKLNPDMRSVKSSKRAALEAKMQLARRELEVAEARSKIAQAELELLQFETDEEDFGHEEEVQAQAHIEQWIDNANIAQEKRPPYQEEKKSDIQELAQVIAKLSQKSSEPSLSKHMIELPNFNGASEEWLAFKRSFEDTSRSFTDAQNLARLRRALQGKAREAVKSLLFTAETPNEVLKGLEARFGRPGAIALAELEKLKQINKVQETPNDICTFASQVKNAVATIMALGKEQYLSSPETMKVLIEKMPANMKYRWFMFHHTHREEEKPELTLIKEFLEIEAEICGDFAPPEVTWENKRSAARGVHTIHEESNQQEKKKECPECKENHWIYECKKFKDASLDAKWEMAKKSKLCFKCLRFRHSRQNCRAPVCRKCSRWHNVVLHSDSPPGRQVENKTSCNTLQQETEEKITSVHTTNDGRAFLKMVPVDLYGPKGSTRVLALLDEGSTISLLDSLVAKKIGAQGATDPITIETVGGKNFRHSDSQKLQIKIKGIHSRNKQSMGVRTIENLKLSKQEVDEETLKNCKHLQQLRSQLMYKKEEPRLLIGQDNWALIVTRRLKKGNKSEPVASLTGLGWVLHGCDSGANTPIKFVNHSRLIEESTDEMVRHCFDIESIGVKPNRPTNDADKRAIDILERTTKRLPSGRFESGLLWKNEEETLPNNYNQAFRRLLNIEKKLDKEQDLKTAYEEQIENLLKNNYAEKAPSTSTPGKTFYLPHFAVIHPIKKKPRIVLDAAAKFEGKSLNDALLPGPDLLQSLFGVLLRFRQGAIAVVADIQEMFLRIQIREADRDSLRFLWRGDKRTGKPEEYRMKSVIFGASSSPSTAIFVMNKNAEDFKEEYPDAVKAIKRNHYMDDYLQSFASIEEAKETAKAVQSIHANAGFHLRGWGSNKNEVLESLQNQPQQEVKELSSEEKTLGLRWLINEDALAFNVGFRNTPPELLNGERIPTKREVASAVMSTFDPMGFAAPILIQGKKLIQEIWRTKVDWDDKIQPEQEAMWLKYIKEVTILRKLKIPRCLSAYQKKGQLHTFTDASEEAYAAVVFWRTEEPEIHIALVAGKAQVTPTKPISIPRLELQAALLGSRLASTIEKELDLEVTKKTFWTDSSTVLQWLKSDPRKFKTFVAHRLAEIEELTNQNDWRWVPTKDNPADDATRGTPNEFDNTARWFKGPTFLYEDEENWPAKRFEMKTTDTGEEKTVHIVASVSNTSTITPNPERFSSWTRLLRCTARVFQFIDILKERHQKEQIHATKEKDWKPQRSITKKKKEVINFPVKPVKSYKLLQEEHFERAKEELIKASQRESFTRDIECLKDKKQLENSSKLKKIDVYIDNQGIMKLRTRTKKIFIENQEQNPIVLDGKNKISRLIIEHYHRKFLHGNTETVINEIRQKYWILSLRTTTRGIIHRCQWCRVRKNIPQIPPLGDHPIERLQHHQHPFTCSAVDYFGPMQVTIGRRTEKRWGALFTCLTTRAIHLELSNSLSTSSMIMALRRMAARRGTPKVIYSDNGTNFVGAHHELEEAAAQEGIRWKFIPAGSPSMGGAWERMVRTVKTALMVVLQSRSPPEEVLHTLLVEVEHIVNSRPLTHISMDPNDEESLTPNHFLIGRSCGAATPGEFEDRDLIGKANWRTAQRLTDHFWQRWIKEYLPTLKPRKIDGRLTTDPEVGDIVLIMDASLPRNTWPRGEVQRVYPGPDGRVRILDVRTPGGVLRRSTRRVITLVPATTSRPKEEVLRTAGETVSDVQ